MMKRLWYRLQQPVHFPKFHRPFSNRRGVALIAAIAAITLMMYLAVEVMYETQVEYIINSQNLNRLKAYYAARSGVEISLLRIKIYQSVVEKLGKNMPIDGTVEQIYKFPFMWPFELPAEMNAVDTEQIKNIMKESKMDASFATKITDEGQRIDINDLNSPSKQLRTVTKKQLLNLFENKKETDEEFMQKYSGFKFEELINNIADWMSNKNASENGGDKRAAYRNSAGNEEFPPNRAFRTVSEVRLVTGMTEEFFKVLEPNITIYGLKGINPNSASKEVLKAIDPAFTDEIIAEIKKRIDDPNLGGPFKDAKDFWEFVQSKGARLTVNTDEIPIITSGLFSFRISSIGTYGNIKKEIELVTLDVDRAATRLSEFVKKESTDPAAASGAAGKTPGATPGAAATPAQSPAGSLPKALPKGAPRIVYWTEK